MRSRSYLSPSPHHQPKNPTRKKYVNLKTRRVARILGHKNFSGKSRSDFGRPSSTPNLDNPIHKKKFQLGTSYTAIKHRGTDQTSEQNQATNRVEGWVGEKVCKMQINDINTLRASSRIHA